jgi:hypothetical protein
MFCGFGSWLFIRIRITAIQVGGGEKGKGLKISTLEAEEKHLET